MKKILVVDDERDMLVSMEKILSQREDFDITLLSRSQDAIERVKSERFDLIITDLRMKDVSGIDILRSALSQFPNSIVIVISGYGTIEASVEAMQEGAYDFIEKPFTSKKLFACIDRALKQGATEPEHLALEDSSDDTFSGLIYKSRQMADIIHMVRKLSTGNMNVLITGESGTGKELIARAVHRLSKRRSSPFVPVNCGALPENLFESELFGHERGAFTGALKTKPGLLEFANHGIFFFDEIGDLSLSLQVKLLRMLEDRSIRRVGGQKEIPIDVRIIAATNKDLTEAVRDRKFREDLYYRLNTIQIEIPPLRDRTDDILPLAYHVLTAMCSAEDKKNRKFSTEAEESLQAYSWPGNVRELQNVIQRAYILCSSEIIGKEDIPLPVSDRSISLDETMFKLGYKEAKEYVLEKFEVEYLTYHLRINQGNISRTAKNCNIDRRSIHRLTKKYNIFHH